MSKKKKLSIVVPGICRDSLWGIFRKYAMRMSAEEDARYERMLLNSSTYRYLLYDNDDEYEEEMRKLREYYGCDSDVYSVHPDDEDDYYVDDDGSIIFPVRNDIKHNSSKHSYWDELENESPKGKHKHKKHRNRHKTQSCKVIDISTPYSGFEEDPDEVESDCIIYYYPDYHDKYERLEFNSLSEFDEYCTEEGFSVPPYVGEKIAYSHISHCCLNPYAKERGIMEIMSEDSYGDMVYEACDEAELSQ